MKKQFVVGMMIMTSVISFNASAGGLSGAKSPKETVVDYMQKVEEFKAAFKGGKVKASSLETAEAVKQQEQTMDDLGLNRGEKASIKSLITSGRAQKIDVVSSLNVLSAAKNGTKGKTDPESVSMSNYADAAVKFMSNAELIGEKKSSSTLPDAEFKDVTQSARKLVEIIEQPTTYEKTEMDSYTAALNRANELAPKSETFEEALVKGVMETAKDSSGKTGVTKERALEILRKIIRCRRA